MADVCNEAFIEKGFQFETEVLRRFIEDTQAINIIPCVILAGNHRTGWPSHGAPPDLPDDYTAYKEDVNREGIEKFLNHVIILMTKLKVTNQHPND